MNASSKCRWRKKWKMYRRRYFVDNKTSLVTCHRVNQKVAVYGHWTRELQVGALTCMNVCICIHLPMRVHQYIHTYNIFIYHAIASLPNNTEMCERDCYVIDVLDCKRDCEGAGERWKGEKKKTIKRPGIKSHLKTKSKYAQYCNCGRKHDWEIKTYRSCY